MSEPKVICEHCRAELTTITVYGTPIHYHGSVRDGLIPGCPAKEQARSVNA